MKKSTKRPHIKAAARGATSVSTVRSGRRFCNFAECRQLVEWAPVSGMPICGRRPQDQKRQRRDRERMMIMRRTHRPAGSIPKPHLPLSRLPSSAPSLTLDFNIESRGIQDQVTAIRSVNE